MKLLIATIVVPLVACLALDLSAQAPTFRTGVAAVRVDVLVTDGRRQVANLTAADFELRDNGVVQTLADVNRESLPLNLICALDVSGSVSGAPLVQLKKALLELFDALGARDRAALLTFSNQLVLHTTLTSDRNRLRTIVGEVTAGGTTSLFDAVFASLALREADENRTLMLLFSDGIDTASWLSAKDLITAARRSDVVIYPVTKPSALRGGQTGLATWSTGRPIADREPRVVDDLADETGGRVVLTPDDTSLGETFLNVLEEFRQRYVLIYEPTGVSGAGWHDVQVKLKRRSGQVKARRGYFAAPATPDPAAKTPRK